MRESGKNPILFQSWKHNNLYNGEGDTRPISLTPCLSKVLENFVVSWLIDDVKDKIDPCQFGCLKGTSTAYCLLNMLHTWLSHLHFHGKHLRNCFLDFSKAFDRVGYNVLIGKLIDSSTFSQAGDSVSSMANQFQTGFLVSAGVPKGQNWDRFCSW